MPCDIPDTPKSKLVKDDYYGFLRSLSPKLSLVEEMIKKIEYLYDENKFDGNYPHETDYVSRIKIHEKCCNIVNKLHVLYESLELLLCEIGQYIKKEDFSDSELKIYRDHLQGDIWHGDQENKEKARRELERLK